MRRRHICKQIILGDGESFHLILRHVDDAPFGVFFHVLQVIRNLQGRANGVRGAKGLFVTHPVQHENDSPDGIRRAAAIIEQGFIVRIPENRDVLFERREQILKRLQRQIEFLNRVGKRNENVRFGDSPRGSYEFFFPFIEACEAHIDGSGRIRDIIGASGESVYRSDVRPYLRRQQL